MLGDGGADVDDMDSGHARMAWWDVPWLPSVTDSQFVGWSFWGKEESAAQSSISPARA